MTKKLCEICDCPMSKHIGYDEFGNCIVDMTSSHTLKGGVSDMETVEDYEEEKHRRENVAIQEEEEYYGRQ